MGAVSRGRSRLEAVLCTAIAITIANTVTHGRSSCRLNASAGSAALKPYRPSQAACAWSASSATPPPMAEPITAHIAA